MPNSPDITNRIQGSLFGLAVCDALGGPVEFKARGSFPLVTSMLPNENFDLPAGCFTDDTSMALCLAQSLAEDSGFDAQDQARKYIDWHRYGYMSSVPERGCFDIGIGTSGVLKAWNDFLTREGGAEEIDPGKRRAVTEEGLRMVEKNFGGESYCGNGSLMRVAPIALVYHAVDIEEALCYARISSRVTHPHIRCQEACSLFVHLVVRASHGANKGALADIVATTSFIDGKLAERLNRYENLDVWSAREEEDISSSGYVLDTLEAALWAFFTTDTFERGAIKAVNLGHDSDTVGAVYGALAGAHYGVTEIPDRRWEAMENKALLQKAAKNIESISSTKPQSND